MSGNATVGKHWLTTITIPQYRVGQRSADVVLICVLENNDGKWLTDMLFDQVKSRRKTLHSNLH